MQRSRQGVGSRGARGETGEVELQGRPVRPHCHAAPHWVAATPPISLMLRILPLALLLAGGAFAQSDNCGNATQINGYGTFSFNNSNASDSSYSPCAGLGRDVFWAWTAPSTENVSFNTCGSSFDTVLAVYDGGGCPNGGAISCNDDDCSLQSSVSISAVAGQTYLVQVGSWNGGSGGSGTLDVSAGGSGGSGGCTNPAVGADVIVGSLNGITKYSASSGVSGYAIGTTSCNVGDEDSSGSPARTSTPSSVRTSTATRMAASSRWGCPGSSTDSPRSSRASAATARARAPARFSALAARTPTARPSTAANRVWARASRSTPRRAPSTTPSRSRAPAATRSTSGSRSPTPT